MAKPIRPTPPVKGADAKAVLVALSGPTASAEEMKRRADLARDQLTRVFGYEVSGAHMTIDGRARRR